MNILSLFQSVPDEDSAILFLEEKRWAKVVFAALTAEVLK